jgi:hypothetical protein
MDILNAGTVEVQGSNPFHAIPFSLILDTGLRLGSYAINPSSSVLTRHLQRRKSSGINVVGWLGKIRLETKLRMTWLTTELDAVEIQDFILR